MKTLIATLALVFYATGAHASVLTLTAPQDLEVARGVSKALSNVTSRVTKCVDEAKKEIQVCRCENKQAIADLEQVYAEAHEIYPQWGDKTLNFPPEDGSNATTALNFELLPHAIAIACP